MADPLATLVMTPSDEQKLRLTYRFGSKDRGTEVIRLRRLLEQGSIYIARQRGGWGLAARTRRSLSRMLLGTGATVIYRIEAIDTGLLRPRNAPLVLHRQPDLRPTEHRESDWTDASELSDA